MSKIEELIEQYCPEGVEFKELGEVMTITRGASPRPISNYVTNDPNGIPWIKIGDVNSKYKYITKTKEKITKEGAEKSRYLKKGDFVLSNSMSFGRPYILAIDGCIHDGWISMQGFESSLISDFLFHLLRSDIVQNYWKQKASSGTVQNLNADIVKATKIPVPPLPIQQEIVTILDKFTKLEAELEAELEARKRQYEFYRNQLLNFEGKEVEWKTLGEVCLKTENIKWKENQNIDYQYIDLTSVSRDNNKISDTQTINSTNAPSRAQQIVNRDDVIFGTTRPTLKRYSLISSGYHNQICSTGFCLLRADKRILVPKFLFFLLTTANFYSYVENNQEGAGYPSISNSTVKKFQIPITPLSEQERIVAILDKFDLLVNDISEGIPAEIQARRKQYEYYRGKLLDFKNINNG